METLDKAAQREEVDAVWRVVDTWRAECDRAEGRVRYLEKGIRDLLYWALMYPEESDSLAIIERLENLIDEPKPQGA